MNVVSKNLEKTVGIAVDRTNQAILDALADHGALFTRDGQHIGFDFGQNFLAEGDIERLGWPVVMAWCTIAEFQMIDTQSDSQFLCFFFKRLRCLRVAGGDATVNGKGQGGQRIAEEQAFDVGQGKDTEDFSITLGVQEISRMAKYFAENALPLGPMEKSGFRAVEDKLVPPCGISCIRSG